MQVFINEKSLHGQFASYNIEDAIKMFLSALTVLNDWEIKRDTFTSNSIYNSNAIPAIFITKIIKANKELNDRFLNNLKSWSFWEDSIEHDTTRAYTYANVDYVNTSLAEISERKIKSKKLPTFLLNFSNSLFGTANSLEIVKAPGTKSIADCVYNKDSMLAWLIAKGIIDPTQPYSVTSKISPQDFQTVLLKSKDFVLTSYFNQGRKVYKRKGYNEYWVVDNFHVGADAHIEVFSSSNRKHMGISDINKIGIDKKYKDKDKTLEI